LLAPACQCPGLGKLWLTKWWVWVAAANVGTTGSCHRFQHALATLMLESGADIRIYTPVAICQLKAVHEATHPGQHEAEDDYSNLDV
jgi:hypothetical protein